MHSSANRDAFCEAALWRIAIFRGRLVDFFGAPRSRISSPSDHRTKGHTGLEHPASRPIVGYTLYNIGPELDRKDNYEQILSTSKGSNGSSGDCGKGVMFRVDRTKVLFPPMNPWEFFVPRKAMPSSWTQ